MDLKDYTKIKLVALTNETIQKEPELKTGAGISTFTPKLKATLDICKLFNLCKNEGEDFETTLNELLTEMLKDIIEDSTSHLLISLMNKNGEIVERSIDIKVLDSIKRYCHDNEEVYPIREMVNMCLTLNQH